VYMHKPGLEEQVQQQTKKVIQEMEAKGRN
jgi:hypothetical protein